MGKYIVNISDKAIKDLKDIYKSGDKKSIKRLERIFVELAETPFIGIGEPEMLKYQYAGYWLSYLCSILIVLFSILWVVGKSLFLIQETFIFERLMNGL